MDTGPFHREVCLFYSPFFAGTHCAYPRRDGQAELAWVAGWLLTEMAPQRKSTQLREGMSTGHWMKVPTVRNMRIIDA